MIFQRESQFREYVTKVAEDMGFHKSHIESPVTSAGVPDLNLFKGVDVWLELKVWTLAKGVKMRPTQKLWHLNRHRSGGLSWVLLTFDDKLSLVPGETAARLGAKDPAWTFGYMEGSTSELPRILRYLHRQGLRQLETNRILTLRNSAY